MAMGAIEMLEWIEKGRRGEEKWGREEMEGRAKGK